MTCQRRKCQKISAAALLVVLAAAMPGLHAGRGARAAESRLVVEIFYLPHPPVIKVVKRVEAILGKYKDLAVSKYDFEDEGNRRRAEKYGLKGHIPVAIFINGKNVFHLGDREVTFLNFPKDDPFLPMFAGKWSYGDLEQVVGNQLGAD